MRALWLTPLLLCLILVSVNAGCPNGCKTCDSKKCTSCERGYFLVNGKCDACLPGCDKCEVFKTDGDAYWAKCVGSCRIGCANCNSDYTCGRCERGYSLYEGQCFSCEGDCDKCDVWYVVTNAHHTHCTGSCRTGCSKCNPDYACAQCNVGYVLADGQCKPCPADCDKCYLSGDGIKCIGSCKGGCEACSNGDTCTRCKSGYVLNNGVCYACSGCNECNYVQVNSTSYRTECVETPAPIPTPTPTPTPDPTPTPTPTPIPDDNNNNNNTNNNSPNNNNTSNNNTTNNNTSNNSPNNNNTSNNNTINNSPNNNNTSNNNNNNTPINSESKSGGHSYLLMAGCLVIGGVLVYVFMKKKEESLRANIQQDYAQAMAAEKQRQTALNIPTPNYQYKPPQNYPQDYAQGNQPAQLRY